MVRGARFRCLHERGEMGGNDLVAGTRDLVKASGVVASAGVSNALAREKCHPDGRAGPTGGRGRGRPGTCAAPAAKIDTPAAGQTLQNGKRSAGMGVRGNRARRGE